MSDQLQTYSIKDWVVFGRNIFKPPFRVSDELINEARIVHVVHGQSNLYAARQSVKLSSGDTYIMKVDNFVSSWQENESSQPNEVIVFQLTSDFLHYLYNSQLPAWFSQKPDDKLISATKSSPSPLLDRYFADLRYYLDNPTLITEELTQIKIRELIFILVKTDPSGNVEQFFGQLFHASEYQFKDVIRTHLFEDLSTDDLAFLTGLSTSSFNRKFKSVYGTSPTKYIISKRLEKAQTLLSTTDQRISEIAYDCGFNDIGYFSKTFKKYYNISPSDFRK